MAPGRNRFSQLKREELRKSSAGLNKISEKIKESNNAQQTQVAVSRPWAPSTPTAFKALLSTRLCAAIWSNISDCDETYNYWEPTHYLMYQSGFQTWEYSPVYAIRSYAYLWLQAIPGILYSNILQSNRILVFYFIRCLLALLCSACEVYFYKGVCHAFGAYVGRLTLAFLVFGAGMFVATTAYLPSTFSMYAILLAFGSWFLQRYELSIVAVAVSSIIGWPFSVLIGLPIAYDIIIVRKYVVLFAKWAAISLVIVLIPVVVIDSVYYGHLVIAPLNIVLYNVFGDQGPNLYGVEPWTFYFVNGFLNFNLVFVAALMAGPFLLLQHFLIQPARRNVACWLCLISLYLWIAVFFTRSHKEERFLFPIYPLFCLAGSITVDILQKICGYVSAKRKTTNLYSSTTNYIVLSFVVLTSVLSVSRSIALYKGYHAPMEVFMELNRLAQEPESLSLNRPANVCIGKEWYRFPTSFFLPSEWHLQFVRSEFRGQLPKQYSPLPNGTAIIPKNMNDQNREEPSRYVDLKSCQYLVDSDYEEETLWEPRYSLMEDDWQIVASVPFLDNKRSPRLLRAFYIPYLSETRCKFVDYNVLQSRQHSINRKRKNSAK